MTREIKKVRQKRRSKGTETGVFPEAKAEGVFTEAKAELRAVLNRNWGYSLRPTQN